MKKINGQYAALYLFSYMALGGFTPLIGQYLAYLGYTGSQIGTITSSGTAVAILAAAFWGRVYSGCSRRHAVLILLCLSSACCCAALSGAVKYGVFILLFAIMYFFQAPVMSLTDAFTVERMQRFGPLRAWGAVGFALGIFLAGIAAEEAGIYVIFPFYMISFCIAAFMVGSISRMPYDAWKRDAHEKEKHSYRDVLRSKSIRRIILCAFFMGGTNVANNTYFSFLYIEGGGTMAGVGIVMLLMVGSEVPFMAWCEKLSSRFTMEKTILAAMIVSVVRFLLYGIGLPWWVLLALAFSQGAVNGILLIEFVRYVSKLAPPGCESLAISAYYIIGSNFSTICCQAVGGRILDVAGASGVYVFFGLFNLIGLIFYAEFIFLKKDKKK